MPGDVQNDSPRKLANDVRHGRTRDHSSSSNREAPAWREKLETDMILKRNENEKDASATAIVHPRGREKVRTSSKRVARKWQSWP